MKLKLTLQERISLAMVLPESGNYLAMLITNEIRTKVQPTMEEVEFFEISQEQDALTWNAEKDRANIKEFEFSLVEITQLLKRVEEVSEAGQVTNQNFNIIHKLMSIKPKE